MRISRHQLLALVERRLALTPRRSPNSSSSGTLDLRSGERAHLVESVREPSTPERVVVRCVIVLMAAAGWSNARIAVELGINRRTVALWKARFVSGGPSALLVDAPGRGRKPGRNQNIVAQILAMTRERPAHSSRWTTRALGRALGVSHATVQRVWREHDIDPSRQAQALSETPAAPASGAIEWRAQGISSAIGVLRVD